MVFNALDLIFNMVVLEIARGHVLSQIDWQNTFLLSGASNFERIHTIAQKSPMIKQRSTKVPDIYLFRSVFLVSVLLLKLECKLRFQSMN